MDQTISELFQAHFPLKTIIIKSLDADWVNKGVRKMSRKKKRLYKKGGKSARWKAADAKTQTEIVKAKEEFVCRAKKKMLAEGHSGAFFKAIKCLSSKDSPSQWNVTNLFPGEHPEQVANKCVEFFSEISRQYDLINSPSANGECDWKIELFQIAARLKTCKKTRSMVKGDVDGRLVTRFPELFAVPLFCIYNKIISDCVWPDLWKQETVKIIPKIGIPESLKDVRNISCTPLFSKVMEHFLLEKLRGYMSLSRTQFGGLKGVSIDHFLCETWHEIITGLEEKESAASLVSVDFSKAFNRMEHLACLSALRDHQVPEFLINIVQSFLFDRKMRVHVDGFKSALMPAPGGAPQGSVLGSFLFCVTTEKLSYPSSITNITPELHENGIDASFHSNPSSETHMSPISAPIRASTPLLREDSGESSDEERINFGIRNPTQRLMDTTVESVLPSQSLLEEYLDLQPQPRRPPSIKAYIDDYNIIEKIRCTAAPSHFSNKSPTYMVHAPGSENIFNDVKVISGELGMVVNDSKTQLLCINTNGLKTRSFINTDSNSAKLVSGEKMKILGFTFGPTPDVSLHTSQLISLFNMKLWSMWRLKNAGMGCADMLMIYKAVVRPTIEFASNTYHSLLTQEQSDRIEQLQLRAMKSVFGPKVSYNTVLQSGLIESVKERRTKNFEKFAEKTYKNPRFRDWFPENHVVEHNLRRREKIFIPRMTTERGCKSPIIQIRKQINSLS